MEMGLVSRRGHQRTGFDFDKIPGGEELPQSGGNAHAPQKKRPAVQMTSPEGRWHGRRSLNQLSGAPEAAKIAGEWSQDQYGAARHLGRTGIGRGRRAIEGNSP
jgi:hypothetical protein